MLQYSKANRKLKKLQKVIHKRVYSFDLLSGYTCPYALLCKSKAVEQTDGSRKIQDGKHCQFRCFSASQEALFKDTFNMRKRNTDAIKKLLKKGIEQTANALLLFMPKNAEVIRIHVAGDFFNEKYFLAWKQVAAMRPDVVFYCYTKALPILQKHGSDLPENFRVTMSRGGTHDHLIPELPFPEAVVVYYEQEAEALGLEIDTNDYHAYIGKESYALLIHGQQPKGSEAAKAVSEHLLSLV
jgi:hypothetical protein